MFLSEAQEFPHRFPSDIFITANFAKICDRFFNILSKYS